MYPDDVPPGEPTRPGEAPAGGRGRSTGTSGEVSGEPLPFGSPPGDAPFEELTSGFYSPGVPLDRLRPAPDRADAPSDLLLRMLESPQVRVRHIPLTDLLRKPYRELGSSER